MHPFLVININEAQDKHSNVLCYTVLHLTPLSGHRDLLHHFNSFLIVQFYCLDHHSPTDRKVLCLKLFAITKNAIPRNITI